MASLTAVIQKLQGLIVTGYEKLGSERRRSRRRKTALSGSSGRGKRFVRKTTSECLCQCKGSLCQVCYSCEKGGESIVEPSVTGESVSNESITPLEWHAALLAYIQLSNQIRERYPQWRDRMYESNCSANSNQSQKETASTNLDGESTDAAEDKEMHRQQQLTAREIKDLKQMLDYAVWAYEPDEEVLRGLLQGNPSDGTDEKKIESTNDGYQLLVHRTTSYIEPSSGADGADNAQSLKNSTRKLRKPPGRVGYYVAVSHSKKELLIGMKGTSTLEDILTDCCGRALRLDLENDPHHLNVCECESSSQQSIADEASDLEEDDHADNSNENDYVIEYENDETLHISMISSGNDPSNPDEIEVNLIEVGVLHHDESVETTIPLHQAAQTHISNTFDGTKSLPKALQQQNTPKRKSSGVNLSTLSAPTPVENILLLPTRQTLVKSNQSHNRGKPTQSNDEIIESHGIEMQPERTTKVRGVHEGLLHCAQQLFSEISPLIEEFALSKGYDVVCTGHSMGAGTSALLAILIRGKYPELVVPNELVERVRVYAFAPPPVTDRATSLACQHYVLSIVNNSDIIPRSSLTNLDISLTMLEAVRNRLVDCGMNPGVNNAKDSSDVCEKPKKIISSMTALYRKLSEGTDGELIIEPDELQRVFDEAVSDALLGEDEILWDEVGDHHLLVPGNVLMLYQPWALDSPSTSEPCESQAEFLPYQESKNIELASSFKYYALWTNGTATTLKGFEAGAGGNMVTDHLTSSYYRALELLEKSVDAEPCPIK